MVDLKRRMDGRRILVVGAGGGIGRACVERLLAEGAVVAAADLGECWQDRPEVFEMPVDVTEQESVDRLIEQVTARLGGLDGFLYSSGVGSSRGFMDTSLAHFDRVIAVNLRGAFYCARKAAEQMGRGGSLVFVASQKGLCGSTGSLAYNASKGGMVVMARSMALELGPVGIRVNCVCPGPTDTQMFREDMGNQRDPQAARASVAASNPLNMIAMAEQIASGTVYVLSEEAAFMTGTELVIDGGNIAGVRNL